MTKPIDFRKKTSYPSETCKAIRQESEVVEMKNFRIDVYTDQHTIYSYLVKNALSEQSAKMKAMARFYRKCLPCQVIKATIREVSKTDTL